MDTSSHIATSYSESPDFNTTWGSSEWELGKDIAVDPSGNVYIAGWTDGFGVVHEDAFLVKHSSSGEFKWYSTWGTDQHDGARGVAVDDYGNVYFTGSLEFGTGDGKDIYLTKYNSVGDLEWYSVWNGTNDERGNDVAIDELGNIYVTGYTESFGADGKDAILLKFNSEGDLQWNTSWGGSGDDYGNDLATDKYSNIYVTGVDYEDTTGNNLFITKYDESSGTYYYFYTYVDYGDGGVDNGEGIAVKDPDHIYIAGTTNGIGVDNDIILVHFNRTGDYQWTSTLDNGGSDEAGGVIVDNSGNICVAGVSAIDGHDWDVVFAQFDPSGTFQWNTTWGGSQDDRANDITKDSSGNIYITGETYSYGPGCFDAFYLKYEGSSADTSPSPLAFLLGGGDSRQISGYHYFTLLVPITIMALLLAKGIKLRKS